MMKRWRERLGRLDSLFLRLFLLMWVTLVLSQLVAFSVVSPVGMQWIGRLSTDGAAALPPLPSLPPGNPLTVGAGDGAPPPCPAWRPPVPPVLGPEGEHPPAGWGGMPVRALWLDYALRALLIGVGAAIGARWLSVPMRRLAQASTTLSQGLAEGRDPPALDEAHGTVEVRDSARAFNRMAQALKHQFDQRSLHMAAVSHDLRTPLTRLRLRLEQLPSDAARAAGADIRAMDELIDASLAVVREQSTAAGPALLDLGALLQSLTDDLAEQGLPVSLAGDGEATLALRVRAHPASLRRVVDNLVDNALRHGGVARLGCRQVGGWAEVTVDDDGPGIAPAQLERVFQPWVRLPDGAGASGSGSDSGSGSGLGLAIARDLAQRDGATLTLDNRPEGGLRARLRLHLE